MASTALVTGCSSGIGYETARALLADGWHVYATARDRDRDGLENLADRGAELAALDLTEPADIERVVARVRDEAGGVDCLINNAGYGQFGPVEDVPTDRLERQFAVHCFGPHRLIRAVLPDMRERGRGRIVNVTSAADRLALAGIGGYTASKWALASLSDGLRQELVGSDVEVGGRLINDPDDVAETILTAATVPDPDTHYRVGPLPLLGSLYGTLVPATLRDQLTKLGIRLAASEPVLDVLERRTPETGAEPYPRR